MCDAYVEAYFSEKFLQMNYTWVYHYEPESKRQSMEWKYTNFPVKKKFWTQQSLKKVIQEPITIDFLEKNCNCKQCFLLPTP